MLLIFFCFGYKYIVCWCCFTSVKPIYDTTSWLIIHVMWHQNVFCWSEYQLLVFHGLWNRYLLYLYIMVESLWSSAVHFSWFELDMNTVVTKMSWDLLPTFVWSFCFRRRQSYPENTKYSGRQMYVETWIGFPLRFYTQV
jgi:hypothetical protein